MKVEVFEGKNSEEVLENGLKSLNLNVENVIYTIKEQKGGLFKSTNYTVKIIELKTIVDYIKNYLQELITNMGLEISFESKIRDQQIYIKMFSNNNPILIGKNGKTLSSLQTICRQLVYNEINKYPNIILDVENYKEKQASNIEHLAKKLAKEVIKTKVEVKMENMNSYERRLVHNALSNFKNISTISEGEDPHRHVIIKYKED